MKNKKKRNKKKQRPQKPKSFFNYYAQCETYNGNIPIYHKELYRGDNYFWFEFSIKPTPISEEYRILLIKFIAHNPYIYLLYPMFPKVGSSRYPVPHNYNHEKQRLCLTFPSYDEWGKNVALPDAYLPWTILWLYYYEEWLYSGEWKGGGYEPNDPEVIEALKKKETKEKKSKNIKSKNSKYGVMERADRICMTRRKIHIERLSNGQ